MIQALQRKIWVRPVRKAGQYAGLFILAFLLMGATAFAQASQPPPEVVHLAPSAGTIRVTRQPVQLIQYSPDPFDMMVASAASFDMDSPVEAHAEFDPPVAAVGSRVVYRVVVTALDESLTMPDKLPGTNDLDLHAGGRGQTYEHTSGMKLRPQTTVIYRTTVTNTGTFTIPAFDLTAYGKPVKVPAATLKVVPSGQTAGKEAPRLLVDLPEGDCYVGQLLRIPLLFPMEPNAGFGGLFQTRITGDFIFPEQAPMGMRIETVQREGKSFSACISEVLITPLREGPQQLIAQAQTRAPHQDPVHTNIYTSEDLLVDSEPVTLDVKPLPTDGVPPGFTGAVGTFQTEPPSVSPDAVRAGEPMTLTVVIRGDGNLGRLVPPKVPALREWESFPAVSDGASSSLALQRGYASFRYTLIPLTDKIKATPVIPFSYFDPKQKEYVPMNIPATAIKVLPGAPGFKAHLPPLETPPTDPDDANREKEPVFTGLESKPGVTFASMQPLQQRWWFALMQLAPAGLIAGLWAWDRRRRFLEQHPEVILKRRARRGLRKQLQLARRAAAARDVAGFVTGAANALREACAPHSAAHPAALVCADVLQELPEPKRQGQAAEVIRRLFAAADALRFGGALREQAELLSLQPEVEQLLEELRARL